VRADQLGQRQTGPLGLEVPQGHVERGDRLGGQPAPADRRPGPGELGDQLADVAGILADHHRRDLNGVRVLARPAGALGIGEADAVPARLGVDLGEQEHHLGHRHLPSGQHLGVADRHGQRQSERGQPDAPDPVEGGVAGERGHPGRVRAGQRAESARPAGRHRHGHR